MLLISPWLADVVKVAQLRQELAVAEVRASAALAAAAQQAVHTDAQAKELALVSGRV